MAAPELDGNYDESSASAMFAYALIRGDRLGLAPQGAAGRRALDALRDTCLIDQGEGARLERICCVAGLGGFEGQQRDGTPSYYLSERIVEDDAKGVGPLMMAETERRLAMRPVTA